MTDNNAISSWSSETQAAILAVLRDSNQIDMEHLNVRSRNRFLEKLVKIAVLPNNRNQRNATQIIEKILQSIEQDISSLEEQTVVFLMNNLSQMIGSNLTGNTASNLFKTVHNVVCEMAVENADLVDSQFVVDYLNSIRHRRYILSRDKTDAFVDLMR